MVFVCPVKQFGRIRYSRKKYSRGQVAGNVDVRSCLVDRRDVIARVRIREIDEIPRTPRRILIIKQFASIGRVDDAIPIPLFGLILATGRFRLGFVSVDYDRRMTMFSMERESNGATAFK